MRRTILFAAALAALGLAGTAQAQMATQEQMPNGNVRTTERTEGAGGTATTRTVDRPDGTRTVTRRVTDNMGNTRTVRHDRGSMVRTVCHSRWSHGRHIRHCVKRYRR